MNEDINRLKEQNLQKKINLSASLQPTVCPNGTYGYDCTLKCNCLNNGRCSYIEGGCEDDCASGWTGASCDVRSNNIILIC